MKKRATVPAGKDARATLLLAEILSNSLLAPRCGCILRSLTLPLRLLRVNPWIAQHNEHSANAILHRFPGDMPRPGCRRVLHDPCGSPAAVCNWPRFAPDRTEWSSVRRSPASASYAACSQQAGWSGS